MLDDDEDDFTDAIVFPEGKRVRAARQRVPGLTLDVLGKRMGKSDGSFISRIERGIYAPNLETKMRLVANIRGLGLEDVCTTEELELLRSVA